MKNSTIILIPATSPNSFKSALFVKAKTAKPMAAAILQNRVTIPILPTMFTMALSLSLSSKNAVWYLLKKYIQFGIPITTTSGGMSAVSNVIL